MTSELQQISNCRIGQNTKIWNFVNLYDCSIGDDCMVGCFVEIQSNVTIGHRCRIQSHSFICSLVTLEDDVFVGHGVMFINDVQYVPSRDDPSLWKPTLVKRGVMIGSNATILPVTIGERAVIGAGAVVTRDVPAYSVVVGNPARVIKKIPVVDGSTKDTS